MEQGQQMQVGLAQAASVAAAAGKVCVLPSQSAVSSVRCRQQSTHLLALVEACQQPIQGRCIYRHAHQPAVTPSSAHPPTFLPLAEM